MSEGKAKSPRQFCRVILPSAFFVGVTALALGPCADTAMADAGFIFPFPVTAPTVFAPVGSTLNPGETGAVINLETGFSQTFFPLVETGAPPSTLPLGTDTSISDLAGIGIGDASASGQAFGGLDPGLKAVASADAEFSYDADGFPILPGYDAFANVYMTYGFEIDGPPSQNPIPVLFKGSGSLASSTSNPYGNGFLSQSYTDVGAEVSDVLTPTVIADEPGGTYDVMLNLSAGRPYAVTMWAYAAVSANALCTGGSDIKWDPTCKDASVFAEADVDPTLTIDPSFADAANYTIVFGPGLITNMPSSVPEPDSLPLLATGFLGLLLASTCTCFWPLKKQG